MNFLTVSCLALWVSRQTWHCCYRHIMWILLDAGITFRITMCIFKNNVHDITTVTRLFNITYMVHYNRITIIKSYTSHYLTYIYIFTFILRRVFEYANVSYMIWFDFPCQIKSCRMILFNRITFIIYIIL